MAVRNKDRGFNTGYVLACANLMHLHDQPTLAADIMAQIGITWAEVRRMDLGDYDMAVLRKIKLETSSRPFTPARATKDTPHD